MLPDNDWNMNKEFETSHQDRWAAEYEGFEPAEGGYQCADGDYYGFADEYVDDIVHLLEGEEGDDQEWKFWFAALIKRAPFVGLEGKRAESQ